ncbi:MAG: serpin family protein [Ilumatobacter sp.]
MSSSAPAQGGNVALPVSDGVQRAAVDPDAAVEALAAGWNDAGFDLLRRLPADDNVVFSPASIGHALLMAAAAGDDTTRTAIESAFGLPAEAHEAWNSIDHTIAGSQSDQVTVTIADRIWPRIEIEPDQQWVDLLAAQHGTDVVPLDYMNQPDASREIINDWVSDRTNALIPELLPDGFIDPVTTVLVLTDAVYFAAEWATPFGKYGPIDGLFTTVDGDKVDVSFMQQLELDDRRGIGDGYVGAEIPYAGNDYSMLILVPDAGRYHDVLDRLDQDLLDEIDNTFTTGPYELLVPKWDDDYQIDLLDWLTEIGAAPGSYPKITPDAFLGAAVHAADITVDEQGTVAAAATALGFEESGPPEPELTVAADRPFIYLIRHRESGLVLFAGHVTNPT